MLRYQGQYIFILNHHQSKYLCNLLNHRLLHLRHYYFYYYRYYDLHYHIHHHHHCHYYNHLNREYWQQWRSRRHPRHRRERCPRRQTDHPGYREERLHHFRRSRRYHYLRFTQCELFLPLIILLKIYQNKYCVKINYW